LIPLRDTVPTRHRPVVTLALIAINVAVFLVELAAPQQHLPTARGQVFAVDDQSAITAEYGFVPCELRGSCPLGEDTVDFGANAPFRVHHVPLLATVLTSMFRHAGWAHFGFNMLFLWVFGSKVEDRLGRARFPAFYLLGGVAALGLQFLVDPGSAVATIGASGAIAAVLASYLGLYPRALILTLVGWIPIPLPAVVFLVIWILLQLAGAAGMVGQAAGGGDGIAYMAHVGGFAFGLLAIRGFDPGPDPAASPTPWP
jgi:membrane associated rhomboid family serine protease